MNNTATDPTNNMPVVRQDGSNRNQDIVQSPGGQMTRAEAVVYAQQNPAAPKTGAALTAHLQRQFKEGKITEQELQLYSVNALRGNDQDPLTEEEQRQHLEHTRDVQEWNMHAAAFDAIPDKIEALYARNRQGLKVQDHSLRALDDLFFQLLHVARKTKFDQNPEMVVKYNEMRAAIEEAKLTCRSGNAMNKLGR